MSSPYSRAVESTVRKTAFADVSARSRADSTSASLANRGRSPGGSNAVTAGPRAPRSSETFARSTTEDVANKKNDLSASGLEEEGGAQKKKRRIVRAAQPKLDFQLLKSDAGLPDVFYKFPEEFRAKALGPGHEVADLRLLLGMFSRWHRRLHKETDFDTFVAKLERIGASNIMKMELRAMRASLLAVMDEDQEPEAALTSGTAAAVAAAVAGAAGPSAAATSIGKPAPTPAAVEAEEDELILQMMQRDYDELLDEFEAPAPSAGALGTPALRKTGTGAAASSFSAASGSRSAGGLATTADIDDLDDEELLELARGDLLAEFEEEGAPPSPLRTKQAVKPSLEADGGGGGLNPEADDDALIELALGLE